MSTGGRLNKLAGPGLLVCSVGFFAGMVSPGPGGLEFLIPALFTGTAGVWLVTRGFRRKPDGEHTQRLARVEQALLDTQLELGSAEKTIEDLKDEREFLRQLTQGRSAAKT